MRPRRCHHTGLRMVVRFVLLSTAVGLLALAAAPYVDRQQLAAPERCSAVRKRPPARAPVLDSSNLRCVITRGLLATWLASSGSILQSCLASSRPLPAVIQPGRAQGVPAVGRDSRRGRRARLCAAQVCCPSPRALTYLRSTGGAPRPTLAVAGRPAGTGRPPRPCGSACASAWTCMRAGACAAWCSAAATRVPAPRGRCTLAEVATCLAAGRCPAAACDTQADLGSASLPLRSPHRGNGQSQRACPES